MNQIVIDRIRAFWQTYSAQADFSSMAKLIRGTLQLCDFKVTPFMFDEVEKMTQELERYLPIMSLNEFTLCTKTILYAQRSIASRRGINYAGGLSRSLTADESALIRGEGGKDNRGGDEATRAGIQGLDDFSRDLHSDADDGD